MTRYYFIHGPDYACVEDIEQARKYRDAGWRLVNHDAYIEAWRLRDMERLRAMCAVQPKAVGETAPIKGAMAWTRYGVDGKEIT